MEKNPFEAFIDLVTFDQTIIAREQQKESLEKEIVQYQKEKELCQKDVVTLEGAVHTLKKDIDACDLEVSCLIEQEKSIEKKRDAAQSVKAFDALNKEMAVATEKRQQVEDTLLQKWQLLEEQQETCDAKRSECAQQAQQHDKLIAAKKTDLKDVVEQLASLEQERGDHVDGIPQDWLDNYDRMRARVNNPVVPVENSVCTGCFGVVSAHYLQELKRHCILPCKSCYRLLYIV